MGKVDLKYIFALSPERTRHPSSLQKMFRVEMNVTPKFLVIISISLSALKVSG